MCQGLRAELLREKQKAARVTKLDKPQRPSKVRLKLDDVPMSVKDRDFLHQDFEKSNEGTRQRWDARLAKLNNDEQVLREGTDVTAAKNRYTF